MIKTNQLTSEQADMIRDLIMTSEQYDLASSCIQMDSGLNYNKEMPCWFIEYSDDAIIGVCSIFAINTFEAEVSLVVHPLNRHSGIGTGLLKEALQIIEDYQYSQVLYVCDEHSQAGKAFINRQSLLHHHTEYTLKFDKQTPLQRANRLLVSRAYEKDLDKIVEINVDAFEDDYEVARQFIESSLSAPTRTAYLGKLNYKPICTLMLGHEDGVYSINGVAVSKDFQGQGYAKEFIQEVLYSIKDHEEEVMIDVDSTNNAAYHLYKKIGFIETRITHYYVSKLR